MKPQTPAKNTTQIHEDDQSIGFRTVCACTSDRDSVDTWIELDRAYEESDEITVTFYVNTYSSPLADNFWKRIKNACSILLGKEKQQSEILLTKQQALNWCKAVEDSIQRLENQSMRSLPIIGYIETAHGWLNLREPKSKAGLAINCYYCDSEISDIGGYRKHAVCFSCHNKIVEGIIESAF